MSANETQVGGDHYKSAYQHWDYVAAAGIAYLPAQVSKYLSRWQKKNGLQDLEKALHFLDKFIEERMAERQKNLARALSFITQNDIIDPEGSVIVKLQDYLSGDTNVLIDARGWLAQKILLIKKDKPSFKEDRCEWKNPK